MAVHLSVCLVIGYTNKRWDIIKMALSHLTTNKQTHECRPYVFVYCIMLYGGVRPFSIIFSSLVVIAAILNLCSISYIVSPPLYIRVRRTLSPLIFRVHYRIPPTGEYTFVPQHCGLYFASLPNYWKCHFSLDLNLKLQVA